MTTPIPPRRRWFQFSLRTVFVGVTLVAMWLGWELKFVRERQAFLSDLSGPYEWKALMSEFRGDSAVLEYELRGVSRPISIPFWQRWLGDEAVAAMKVTSEQKVVEAKRLFPEIRLLQDATDTDVTRPLATQP